MKCLILLGLVAFTQAALPDTPATAANFCSMSTCKPTQSVACAFTQSTAMLCAGSIVPLDKTALLQYHNNYRSQIAGGAFGFPQAAQMMEMQWSDELAQMALYNVKRCTFSHDICRKTTNFPFAGQNLAISTSSDSFDYASGAKGFVDMWFNEYKQCSVSFITKYYSDTSVMIGHFTQLVKDTANFVGCAAVNYINPAGVNTYLMACNYARTNMIGEPTYVSGPTGSKCTKPSTAYKGLCLA